MDLAALLKLGNREAESNSNKEREEAGAVKVRAPEHKEPQGRDLRGRGTLEEKSE